MTGDLRQTVRKRYADAATADACCCGPGGSCSTSEPDFGSRLYRSQDLLAIPQGAAAASLGCGNPTSIAELSPGETVLDLGSGAGIDVLLSARRVGPDGFAYGLDMTGEMLELARKHAEEADIDNVEFLEGYIEDIPLEAETVDVVISNCVINLSPDKQGVFSEMCRVLRPGGRIGISDVVAEDQLTADERLERGSWVGCIAGALSFSEYAIGLAAAGFTDVSVTPTHAVADGMHSAIIKATKPVTATRCGASTLQDRIA
jgi:SAM-dependent methyltransferase